MSSRVMNMTLSFDSAKALRQIHAQVRRIRSRVFTLPTKTGKSYPIKKTYERRGEFSSEQFGQNTGRTPEGINFHPGLPEQFFAQRLPNGALMQRLLTQVD